MRFTIVAAFISAIALAESAQCYELDRHETDLVRAGISGDPIFGTLKAAESENGDVIVCGTVNTKNQYGQYMGDSPFIGSLLGKGDDATTFFLIGIGINPTDGQAIKNTCVRHGILN